MSKGDVVAASRVCASAPSAPSAPQPPSSSNPSKESMALEKRQMYSVELNPGETTIVSWKKLHKEGGKGSGKPLDSIGSDPIVAAASAAGVQPVDDELQDAQPSSRFNAVIEKIERLYMGKQSSDEEELDYIPDDDQYDTEDSFIDDAELDEYFQVDKLSTKHNGYFVNRGKLERTEPSPSPNVAPKKRRRKDPTKVTTETGHQHVTSDVVTMGRIKAAARSAPSMGNKLASPAKIQTAKNFQEGKVFKNKLNSCTGTFKKGSAEPTANLETISPGRISKDVSSPSLESKDFDKHKAGVLQCRDHALKSRLINESVDAAHQASHDRTVCSPESLSMKSLNCENEAEMSTKVRRKERYGADGLSNMHSAGGAFFKQAEKPSSTRVKDGSSIRSKGITLERAIRDLEKIVALCRPPKPEFQEVDTSHQEVKRRLPQEVKHKLAKVARLWASQNKISEEELIDRLMGIVGHIVQRKTLKRNLRDMVEVRIWAKQEKNARFQQIKQEVNEMIRTRVSLLKSKAAEQQNSSADDFQEVNGNDERRALRKYGMDIALEDKMRDLYDLYVEGMDKDKRPQSRLLYAELAELWPNGYIDTNGIKDSISRSKERKRSRMYRHKIRDEERIKTKQLASEARAAETSLGTQVQSGQERPSTDSKVHVIVPPEKVSASQPVASSSNSGHHQISKHHEKARASTSSGLDADVKKKIKRNPESDLQEIHAHPKMMEWSASQKHSDDSNSFQQPKRNHQLPGAPAPSDQQS